MTSWTNDKWKNTGIMANQAILTQNISGTPVGPIGNPRPPNTSGANLGMLKTASPKAFDLTQTTVIDTSAAQAAANKCRTYVGAAGLARLKSEQPNRTYYDAGCGWLYKQGSGGLPTISRGALGSYMGPVFNRQGEPDDTTNGAQFTMDLDEATRALAAGMNVIFQGFKNMEGFQGSMLTDTCNNMKYIPDDDKEYYGFCTSTGRIIPITMNSDNSAQALYPEDNTYGCMPDKIIPATKSPGGCSVVVEPTEENYLNYTNATMAGASAGAGLRQGLGIQGNLKEAFQTPAWAQKKKSDGFQNMNDLDKCVPPLTNECITLAARKAGCSDNGTIISALKGSESMDTLLKNKAYKAYQKNANPGMTPAMFRDGSIGIGAALNEFRNLANNTDNGIQNVKLAARDLCLQSGEYDTYNFDNEWSTKK